MTTRPCKECGRRPKWAGRHRCKTCYLRQAPIGEQVEASRRRLAMVPAELRQKRTKTMQSLAPSGTAWCAGCQSFRDLEDFGKGATQCRPCASSNTHAARVAKVYGLEAGEYDALLKRQGGRCAICRARPKTKRLAVDHDHKTDAVRGLLCSRCNHDLLGSAWDSLAMATALWHYLNTPPALGVWVPPEQQPLLAAVANEAPVSPPHDVTDGLVVIGQARAAERGAEHVMPGECARPHYLPTGVISVPGKRGVWRVWVEPDGEPPF